MFSFLKGGKKKAQVPKLFVGKEFPLLFPVGHFYSPIADREDIEARQEQIWARTDTMAGVELNEAGQLHLLDQLAAYTDGIDFPIERPTEGISYFYKNDQFPVLDAEFLFAALRMFKPKRVIEIGSGFSSLITAKVNREYFNGEIEFSCVEPYPRPFLREGVEGISNLVVSKVEQLDLSFFDALQAGDILFIDSSHVSKVGSDVNYLFFEVIPRLRPGVIVHIHDIFLPDEYSKAWMIEQGRNWNEQYLVRCFLQFNREFEVIWAAHFMATRHEQAVSKVFPRFPALGGGGSLWIRRVGGD